MLAITIPTPDQIDAYSASITGLVLALGGLVVLLERIRRALDRNTNAQQITGALVDQNTQDRAAKTAATMEQINGVAVAVGAPTVEVPPTPPLNLPAGLSDPKGQPPV